MSYIPYSDSVINYYKSIEENFKFSDVKVLVVVSRNGDKNLEEILKKLYTLNHVQIITKKPGDDFISEETTKNFKEEELRELKYIAFSKYPEFADKDCNEYILLITPYCVLPIPSLTKGTNLSKYKDIFADDDSIKKAMPDCILFQKHFTYIVRGE